MSRSATVSCVAILLLSCAAPGCDSERRGGVHRPIHADHRPYQHPFHPWQPEGKTANGSPPREAAIGQPASPIQEAPRSRTIEWDRVLMSGICEASTLVVAPATAHRSQRVECTTCPRRLGGIEGPLSLEMAEYGALTKPGRHEALVLLGGCSNGHVPGWGWVMLLRWGSTGWAPVWAEEGRPTNCQRTSDDKGEVFMCSYGFTNMGETMTWTQACRATETKFDCVEV